MRDDDQLAGDGDLPEEGSSGPGSLRNPDEIRAAEAKFLEARDAWFKERNTADDED